MYRYLRHLALRTNLEGLSFVKLSSELLNLERLKIYGSLDINDLESIYLVQFRALKFFKLSTGRRQNLNITAISHIIDNCFPKLRGLDLRKSIRDEGENILELKAVPLTCDSFSTVENILKLVSLNFSKRIKNLCVYVGHKELKSFLSETISVCYANFSLKVLNIFLDDRNDEHIEDILSMALKIIKESPQLEILSIRRKRQLYSSMTVAKWIADNLDQIGSSNLKLLIIDHIRVMRSYWLTLAHLRLIDELDIFYGFFIRNGSNSDSVYI